MSTDKTIESTELPKSADTLTLRAPEPATLVYRSYEEMAQRFFTIRYDPAWETESEPKDPASVATVGGGYNGMEHGLGMLMRALFPSLSEPGVRDLKFTKERIVLSLDGVPRFEWPPEGPLDLEHAKVLGESLAT